MPKIFKRRQKPISHEALAQAAEVSREILELKKKAQKDIENMQYVDGFDQVHDYRLEIREIASSTVMFALRHNSRIGDEKLPEKEADAITLEVLRQAIYKLEAIGKHFHLFPTFNAPTETLVEVLSRLSWLNGVLSTYNSEARMNPKTLQAQLWTRYNLLCQLPATQPDREREWRHFLAEVQTIDSIVRLKSGREQR